MSVAEPAFPAPSAPSVPAPLSVEGLERLHPNVRTTWQLGAAITVGVLTLVGVVAEFALTRRADGWPVPAPLLSLGGGAALLVVSLVYNVLAFARFGYAVRPHDVVVQSGVIWRGRRCVPRARVQHVDLTNGPIDRAFGLVEVQLYVAGGLGAVATIPGLSPQAAEQLREVLVGQRADGV